MNHNSASGEEALGLMKKGMGEYIQKIPRNIQIRPKDHTASNISHPGKDLRATNSRILSLDKKRWKKE